MQSHDDRDHADTPKIEADFTKAEALEKITQLASDLSARQANSIAAGAPGERILAGWRDEGILVRQMPPDPLALRVSIGEAFSIGEGAYCVFRGYHDAVIRLVERALAALRIVRVP